MKEIIELFNKAINLFKELTANLDTLKKENDIELENELKNKVIAIGGIPYLNIPKYDSDKTFIPTFNENSNPITNTTFEDVKEPELKQICKDCEPITESNFEPLNPNVDSCCDDEPLVSNEYIFKKYNEPVIIEDGNLGDIDNLCVNKAKEWSDKITKYSTELTELKKWESDNFKLIEYWTIFWIYFDNRLDVLKDLNIDFNELTAIITSLSITKNYIERLIKSFSNELSVSNGDGFIVKWSDKKQSKRKGNLWIWTDVLNDALKTIAEDDKDRTQKILDAEASIKKDYLINLKTAIKDNILLWTKKDSCRLLLKSSKDDIINNWNKEYNIYSNNTEWLNIKTKTDRIKELTSLLNESLNTMQSEMKELGCIIPENENTLLPNENVEYRDNPNINSPNSLDKKWWLKFSSLATLMNLIPLHWPVGILIPSPSGLIKIPTPIIWIPLIVIPIPTGVVVFFIGQCGMCPSPVLFVWNSHPSKSLGPVNANSMSFPVAIRPSNNWRKDGGSKILPIIPWISNLFSKYDPFPDKTKKIPYLQDDLPSWERLSIKNPYLLLFLYEWCKNGKKSCGFFENP